MVKKKLNGAGVVMRAAAASVVESLPAPKKKGRRSVPGAGQALFQNRIVGYDVRPAGSFLANPDNWRIHPVNQQAALSGVLEQVGWVQDVIVNLRSSSEWPEDKRGMATMVDGHLRVTLALRQGESTPVPCKLVDLTPKEEALVLTTLDPIAGLAATDTVAIERLLAQLDSVKGDGLRSMLSEFADDYGLSFAAPKIKKVDVEALLTKADELQKKWKVKVGDLWCLGGHRLLCGDSADPKNLERLFAGALAPAALMATDPPYLVDYTAHNWPRGGFDPAGHRGLGAYWDEHYIDHPEEGGSAFLVAIFKAWQPYLKKSAAWFVFHADKTRADFDVALGECGIVRHQVIVWVKPVSIIGFSKYYMRHEPIWFGWLKGHSPYLHKDFFRSNGSVWYVPLDVELDDVWELGWERGRKRNTEKFHPTQKPIELFARPMRNHTRLGEICCEPFSGSGSQILAGEQSGRVVYAMEKSPAFCSVSLERFWLATGVKPIKEQA